MVVYLDSVFVLNAVMDYVLCLVTGRLAGIRLCRWRYLAAGLVGGLYSVAVFLPGCAFLSEIPVKLAPKAQPERTDSLVKRARRAIPELPAIRPSGERTTGQPLTLPRSSPTLTKLF